MNLFIKFLICGILSSLLFPPFFIIPLGFVIFPYLFLLFTSKEFLDLKYKQRFFLGLIYGFGFFSIYLGWIKEPFFTNEDSKNYFLYSYILIIYCSIYFGLIFILINLLKTKILKLISLPCLMVLAEFFCSNFSYGFPWFSFSLIHSSNIVGMTIVYYIGPYGLSFLTICIFLLPAIFFIKQEKFINILYFTYLVFIIIIIFLTLARNIRYKDFATNDINVTLSQLNFPIKKNINFEDRNLRLKEIIKVIESSNSDIIIFAENNYPFLIDEKNIEFLQTKINDQKSLIVGATRKENNKYYNSLLLINKNKYKKFDKKILVPFGEFIPFRKYLNFMESIAGNTDFSKGDEPRILNYKKNINLLPIICYEIIYFWKLLNKENFNTNIIINLTNDSWFGKFSGPYQHFYFTKLRAAQFNKLTIRVSNNGISGIIDNKGKIIEYIDLNQKKNLVHSLNINKEKINYLRFHNTIPWIIIMLLIFFLFADRYYEKRKI